MASNFTVVLFTRQHVGNEPGSFNDIEPSVPFVGPAKDFTFDCPNIDPSETACLKFQSRDVDHRGNVFQINGVNVFGGLPVSPSRDAWNGNILLVEPHHRLQEAGNVLHVEARNSSGQTTGDIDDFIIDNVVIEYKTLARPVSLTDYAPLSGGDWTAALREAIAELKARWGGGTLLVPEGRYRLNETIVVSEVHGLVIHGHGAIATDFEWAGGLDGPMFEFNRTQGCYLEHVSITARRTHPLLEGVRIQQFPPGLNDPNGPKLSSSLMTIRDVIFNGQRSMGTAVRVRCVDPEQDIKNDFHRFERLQIAGCLHAGLVLEGRNAKEIDLRSIVIQGRGDEDDPLLNYGVLTVANASPLEMTREGGLGPIGDGAPVYNHGAAFSWIGGCCIGTRIANVCIGDRNDTLLLAGIYSEKSARWLVVPDYAEGAVAAFPIKLDSLRYTVNPHTPADGEIIQVHSDSLMITNCDFGRRQRGEQIRIRFQPAHPPGAFVLQGNTITNAGDGNVFVAQPPDNPDYSVTNLGYDGSALVKLGPGAVVDTDGPADQIRIYPKSVAQWNAAGLPWPSSLWDFSSAAATPAWMRDTAVMRGDCVVNGDSVYRCVTEGTTAAIGDGPTGTGTDIADGTAVWDHYGQGTGVIRDLISTKDLLIVGTVEPGHQRSGFEQSFIQLTQSGSESLQFLSNAYDPADDAVAVVLDFEITRSTSTRTIVHLGTRNPSPGSGGLLVRVTAAGLLQLNADGITVTGAVNHADLTVHRMMVTWDPTASGAGRWLVATDAEVIVGRLNPGGNVLNGAAKGFGVAFDGYLGGAPAWFYGDSAREIATSSSRTILGVQDTNPS